MLSHETPRLLAKATLDSGAASYKQRQLASADLAYVLNGVNEALVDPRLEAEIPSGVLERSEALYRLRRFFSRIANIQLRQQRVNPYELTGRQVLLLEALPQRFPARLPQRFQNFHSIIHDALGASIRQLAEVHMAILDRYRSFAAPLHSLAEQEYASLATLPESRRKAIVFHEIAQEINRESTRLAFAAEDLPTSVAVFGAFVDAFARPVKVLRELAVTDAYRYGETGWRLSPLERHPLVGHEDEELFVAPNLRMLVRAFEDVIHYTLMERIGTTYNEYRGYAQELFLSQLIAERLDDVIVLERSYQRGKHRVDGPDVCVVRSEPPSAVLVESKGRRTLAEVRSALEDEALDRNLDDVYRALLKLPQKVADLQAGFKEFEDVQGQLGSALSTSPLAVAVVGDTVFFLTTLIRYRACRDSSFPLYRYPYAFCVLSLEEFEMAVEVARANRIALHDVLVRYAEESEKLEISEPSPDLFSAWKAPSSSYSSNFWLSSQ